MIRLLAKSDIDRAKANDRQREVNEGMKLAKNVDSLRETRAHEESVLNKFRDESLKETTEKISTLSKQKESLEDEVSKLQEDRIRLSAPIDLTEEWEKVKRDRVEVDKDKEENFNRDIELVAREVEVHSSRKEIEDEKLRIENQKEITRKFLNEADINLSESSKTKKEVNEWKKEAQEEMKRQEEALSFRERNVKAREQELLVEKEKADKDRKDIQIQQIRLKDQRETLERALNRLKK